MCLVSTQTNPCPHTHTYPSIVGPVIQARARLAPQWVPSTYASVVKIEDRRAVWIRTMKQMRLAVIIPAINALAVETILVKRNVMAVFALLALSKMNIRFATVVNRIETPGVVVVSLFRQKTVGLVIIRVKNHAQGKKRNGNVDG